MNLRVLALGLLLTPGAVHGQEGWRVVSDPFADLVFHTLAGLGLYGPGPTPLYDPAYHGAARDARAHADGLRSAAGAALKARLAEDPAFDVLHFLPLYFRGADVADALAALDRVAEGSASPWPAPSTRAGADALAHVVDTPGRRGALAAFVAVLNDEWRTVVAPRRRQDGGARGAAAAALQRRWERAFAPLLAPFLAREGQTTGTLLIAPALGPEGRYLPLDPGRPGGLVVAVGVPTDTSVAALDGVLGAAVRELCYPVATRAFAPFEVRAGGTDAARTIHGLAATRCGDLLLEHLAPGRVAAYRARFGIPAGMPGRAFLTVPGLPAGATALEAPLDVALRRELALDNETAGAPRPPVGRRP